MAHRPEISYGSDSALGDVRRFHVTIIVKGLGAKAINMKLRGTDRKDKPPIHEVLAALDGIGWGEIGAFVGLDRGPMTLHLAPVT